mmetsp:Transcript_105771/g.207447  ORF Transcript_105771/g.207447 Transcript_105771/m.207447 type:complete len:229 (+) Transcript_105771:476-1162(+)
MKRSRNSGAGGGDGRMPLPSSAVTPPMEARSSPAASSKSSIQVVEGVVGDSDFKRSAVGEVPSVIPLSGGRRRSACRDDATTGRPASPAPSRTSDKGGRQEVVIARSCCSISMKIASAMPAPEAPSTRSSPSSRPAADMVAGDSTFRRGSAGDALFTTTTFGTQRCRCTRRPGRTTGRLELSAAPPRISGAVDNGGRQEVVTARYCCSRTMSATPLSTCVSPSRRQGR